MNTMKHVICLEHVLRRSWNPHPEEVFHAITTELHPVLSCLRAHHHRQECELILWILTELITNAVNALFSAALITKTHLSRNILLTVFQVNPLHGEVALRRLSPSPSEAVVRTIEHGLGMRIPTFLRLPHRDKFTHVGVWDAPHDILVQYARDDAVPAWACQVESSVPPTRDDVKEIRARIHRYDTTLNAIHEQRRDLKSSDGCYWLPSLTGGGGMGLLACLRKAQDAGCALTFCEAETMAGKTVFRLFAGTVSRERSRSDGKS